MSEPANTSDAAAADAAPENTAINFEEMVRAGMTQAIVGLWPNLATFVNALKVARANGLVAQIMIVFQPNGAIMISEPRVVRPEAVPTEQPAAETDEQPQAAANEEAA